MSSLEPLKHIGSHDQHFLKEFCDVIGCVMVRQ